MAEIRIIETPEFGVELAAMAGEEEERDRQLKIGREAYRRLQGSYLSDADLEALFADIERGKRRRRPREPVRGPSVTTNLGDALRAAGVTAANEEEG